MSDAPILRVLHCIHSLSGGGAERQLCLLANASHEQGMQAGIFSVSEVGQSMTDRHIERFLLSDEKKYPVKMADELSDVVQRFAPDVIHAWLPAPMNIAVLRVAHQHRIPVVASYRNRRTFDSWQRIPDFIAMLLWADRIVANNPAKQSSLFYRKLFKAKNGVEIPNAVKVPYFKRSYPRGDASRKRFIFVGRLTEQKNWRTLLAAFTKLSKSADVSPDWELLLCGDGEDRQELDQIIDANNLGARVNAMGFCDDIYTQIAQADYLVLPSWFEGMPNVVLEAMALGVPCAVSRIPAHEAIFDDSTVAFFEPDSTAQLADILAQVIAGELDLSQISNRVLRFSEEFSAVKMAERYCEVYSELANSKTIINSVEVN